jgi:hypothetical protein
MASPNQPQVNLDLQPGTAAYRAFHGDREVVDAPEQTPEVYDAKGGPSVDGSEDNAGLSVPETVSISSQTVRLQSDGTVAIDVILSIDDVHGATNYEVRFV